MGSDKALLKLAGRPLIEHAVTKLRRLSADVHVLAGAEGGNYLLAEYAPLVYDLHADTGPIGGIQAALVHSVWDWNLILPVDVPLLPTAVLACWIDLVKAQAEQHPRVALFSVMGRVQPTLLLIHREAGPFLTETIQRGEYKLFPALERAACGLRGGVGGGLAKAPWVMTIEEAASLEGWHSGDGNVAHWRSLTEAQRDARPFWFANLNTPADFVEAEGRVEALDT